MKKLFFFSVITCSMFVIGCNSGSTDANNNNNNNTAAPAETPASQQTTPVAPETTSDSTTTTTTTTITPDGAPAGTIVPAGDVKLNPPHGEPGHRCDIAVGAPLPM